MIEPSFECQFNIQCPDCKKYSTDKSRCCGLLLNTANMKYFVSIPIKQQLIKSIQQNFIEIMAYKPNSDSNVVFDAHDGKQYREIQAKYPSFKILSLVVNTDGAAVYRTVLKKSVWPLQLYQNYLLPNKRYKPTNIILNALHFLSEQPNMQELFYPLLNELKEIQNDGGIVIERNGCKYNFLPLITHCCCDLPAKVKVQGTTGHSGHKACGFCLHPGTSVKPKSGGRPYVRYIKSRQPLRLRTHTSMLSIYKNLKSVPIEGVKQISCLVAANGFDLIKGFTIDYMHCVLLCVVKKMLSLWFDSTNHKNPYYITKQKQREFDENLKQIKPTSNISNKPKSIFDKCNYKAKDYRLMLLFYLRCCLPNKLDDIYINHFQLLSVSIYSLLQESMTIDDIEKANVQLKLFADEFESLYGQENVTLNLHMLRHISESVKELGPLWCQSAFGFESNNGVLVRSNRASRNILHSMAWKYTVKSAIEDDEDKQIGEVVLKSKFNIELNEACRSLLQSSGINCVGEEINVFKSVKIKSENLSSLASTNVTTIDYCVQFNDKKIGLIEYYINFDNSIYIMVKLCEVMQQIDHLSVIRTTNTKCVYGISDIVKKLLYMKVEEKEFVSSFPNKYEEN